MIDTQIFDNVIPLSTQQRFLSYVADEMFAWNDYNHVKTAGMYYKNVSFDANDSVVVPSDSLIKLVYYNNFRQYKVFDETLYWLGLSVLDEYQRLTGDTVNAVMRIKVNNQGKSTIPGYDERCCNEIHVDNFEEHKTLIYYLNDSDGDTFLFDKIWNQNETHYSVNVEKRVTPKQGRFVCFNGRRFHAPSNPIYYPRRYIMNINFV